LEVNDIDISHKPILLENPSNAYSTFFPTSNTNCQSTSSFKSFPLKNFKSFDSNSKIPSQKQ